MYKRNIIIISLVILLGIAGYFLPRGQCGMENIIYIHITGAVYEPGIVAVSFGATVQDAIDAAGGSLPQADLAEIDGTQKLTYAQPINIPSQ